MATIQEIRPRKLRKVIDVVREAGIDVSDWANSKRGAAGASTNPKYCYEWGFLQEGVVAAFNLWHHDLKIIDGSICSTPNPRPHSQKLALAGRGGVAARARHMDDVVRTAFEQQLPVRAILLTGIATEEGHLRGDKLHVECRELDPVPWMVTSYDYKTGECLVTRGATPRRFVDQWSIPEVGDGTPATREVKGTVHVRSAAVREAVLLRAGGKCEWCGSPGFITSTGYNYLETHHVVPLSEGGKDLTSNVVALCPNHHREAHHGQRRDEMKQAFLDRVT